jgi:hypothetical protein
VTVTDMIPIKGTHTPPLAQFKVLPGGLEKRILFPWDWRGSAIDEDYDAEYCAGWHDRGARMNTSSPLAEARRHDAIMPAAADGIMDREGLK